MSDHESPLTSPINNLKMTRAFRKMPDLIYWQGWEFEPKQTSDQLVKINYLKENRWELSETQSGLMFKSPHESGKWYDLDHAVLQQNRREWEDRNKVNALMEASKQVSATIDPKVAAALKAMLTALGVKDEQATDEIVGYVSARLL